jgi:formylglycine-generating enzyme required for sulfatase activity
MKSPKFNIFFSILIIGTTTFSEHSHATLSCFEVHHSQRVEQRQQMTEVRDLKTFGRAMTEGMLLQPDQADLFEIYRKVFLGNPNTSVGDATLKKVTNLLKKHPDLMKPHFREYEIETVLKIYESPQSLLKYLKSQTVTAGQIRSNLFQIEANLDYWKRVLNYPELSMPLELQRPPQKDSSDAIKATYKQKKAEYTQALQKDKERFEKYLRRLISKTNQDLLADLKNEKEDYFKKAKALYKTLEYMEKWMAKNSQETGFIRQAMVDLVHTVGFGNQATQALLKSSNAIDKIEGLKKLLDERDTLAMELAGGKHFPELMKSLGVDFPAGLSKNEDPNRNIQNLERQVLASSYTTRALDPIRVRSLSIQEAPFRSCLGGSDCSSRTYFSKALDPNFNYFTMTDSQNHSSGHVTVVLGTAKDSVGVERKVAFIDKLQNVPNQMIPIFLEAVRRSLGEKGYLLGVPVDVGDHNGLSNMDTTRHFIANEVLPKLKTSSLSEFTPHPNQYKFENRYSRAYDKLSVKVYELTESIGDTEIRPGLTYDSRLADSGLNKQNLVQDLINLRDSPQEQDALKFIFSGQTIVAQLEKLGLFSQKEFISDLGRIANDSSRSFQIRRQAFYEILLLSNKSDDNTLPDFQSTRFSEAEKAQMISEVKQWSKSSDQRKKKCSDGFQIKWFVASRTGNETMMNRLLALKLVDINQKNARGYSALTVAVQNYQVKVVHLLLNDPRINILEVDNKGFTVLDHALALGHQDLVALIKEKRPGIKWNGNENIASRVHQTMDFIRVEPGTFKMGDAELPTAISKPVEIMSTLFTQKMYFKIMGENPSSYKDGENTEIMRVGSELQKIQPDNPVENVSYENGVQLLKKINELSKQDAPLLYELIPDHTRGAKYDFITEAQIEYVMKKAKTEDGDTIDEMIKRNDVEKLKQYVVFSENSGGRTYPVGSQKPLFVDGKPIHDLVGNISVWIKDWFQIQLFGGTDPQGPKSGFIRVLRGGGWQSSLQGLYSTYRSNSTPEIHYRGYGFRFVRTAP